MKILYISSVPSQKEFIHMREMLKPNIDNAKYGMQESGYKFHHLIIDGIVDNKYSVYSLIGRPISFHSHKGLYWKNVKDYEKGITYEHIGLVNIPVLKNIFVCLSYLFKTLKWLRKNKNEKKCIIIDAAYITVIPFINLATKIRRCRKIAIVCDIYEYMADVSDARENKSKVHRLISKVMKKNYMKMDGFVFLTEAMNDVLNKKHVPYIVMEGLVDKGVSIKDNIFKNKDKKDVIMYAGALRRQYGLKNLIDGFIDYENNKAELWIFGAGDYVPNIKKAMEKDHRIKYFGIVDNKEVVKKEMVSTLLVNPRPVNQEFTKYSFPSKNMEYMVSGTPVLTTKLPGMPKEYYEYVFLIDGNEPKDITKAFNEVFKNNRKELHNKGLNAQKFVLEKKNNVVQAEKIINLCKLVNNYDK